MHRAAERAGRWRRRRARSSSHEYRLNHLLFTYAKPTVAFMDGITMGGGVGIALPVRLSGRDREYAASPCPRPAIGLFPDVGGGWYLSRLPGRIGAILALTGARLDGAECVASGLRPTMSAERPARTGEGVVSPPLPAASQDRSELRNRRRPRRGPADNETLIDRLFASDDLEDILAALDADGGDWATTEAATIRTKSPQTMKVSLRLLAEGGSAMRLRRRDAPEYAVAAPRRAAPRFPRRRARGDGRQGQCAALGPGDARGGYRRAMLDADLRAAAGGTGNGRRSRRCK